MRLRCALAAVVALSFAIAACGRDGGGPAPAPTQPPLRGGQIVIPRGQPLTIGVSASLSGDQSSIGNDIADATELAVADAGDMVRGRSVHVERRDDGCTDAERAVTTAKALIEIEGLAGVIGPICTTGTIAAGAVYEQSSVVHITPAVTRAEVSAQGARYFFRTAWREDLQARTQAAYARDGLDAETAVVVDDGEPYGKALAEAFAQEFEERGGRVLSRERIERGEVDFSSLAARVESANPSVVVFEGLNPEGALVVRKLRETEYSGRIIAPDGLFSVRDYIIAAGPAAEGSVLTSGPTPDIAFLERFSARFGREPITPFALQAHDAATLLLRAIDAAATEDAGGALVIDREKLADALRSQDFSGLTGRIHFDERGDRTGGTARELGLVIYRVMSGRFEPVD